MGLGVAQYRADKSEYSALKTSHVSESRIIAENVEDAEAFCKLSAFLCKVDFSEIRKYVNISMNSNPNMLALARFPNLANVQAVMVFTITDFLKKYLTSSVFCGILLSRIVW